MLHWTLNTENRIRLSFFLAHTWVMHWNEMNWIELNERDRERLRVIEKKASRPQQLNGLNDFDQKQTLHIGCWWSCFEFWFSVKKNQDRSLCVFAQSWLGLVSSFSSGRWVFRQANKVILCTNLCYSAKFSFSFSYYRFFLASHLSSVLVGRCRLAVFNALYSCV